MRRLSLEFCGIVLAGIMALALPCIATSRDSSTAGKTGTITGKVVDASGNPVGGVIVRVMRLPKGVNLPSGGGPGGGPGGPGVVPVDLRDLVAHLPADQTGMDRMAI